MSKRAKCGDYLKWKGKLAQIIGTYENPSVIIEMMENKHCPHCNGDLGKEQIHMITGSPLFQNNAEKIESITD